MNIEQIEKLTGQFIGIAGLTAIISFFFMHAYLIRNKLVTYSSFFDPIWLKSAFIYRDHTKSINGKTGLLYSIFGSSFVILIPIIFFELVIVAYEAPKPIFFIICLSLLIFASLIGFVIYKLSREKYI